MKKFFKWFLIISIIAIIGLSFSTCDYNPDEDGDGSFYMSGEANSSNSYDYRFLNQSRTTIKYSPTDKVKPDGGGPTVYFRNE